MKPSLFSADASSSQYRTLLSDVGWNGSILSQKGPHRLSSPSFFLPLNLRSLSSG